MPRLSSTVPWSGATVAFSALLLVVAPVGAQPSSPVVPPAPSASAHPEGAAVAERLGLGAVLDSARHGQRLYLALARGGIAVVEVTGPSARLVTMLAEGRRIVRLALTSRALVAVEQREEALAFDVGEGAGHSPVSLADALGAPAVPGRGEAPSQAPAPSAAAGAPAHAAGSAVDAGRLFRVTAVDGAEVTFDGGRSAGLVAGQRLRLETEEGGADVVVEVERVTVDSAVAVLGRGEGTRVGAQASLTQAPVTSRLLFPVGTPARLRWGFHARPFLGLDARTASGRSTRAGGVLADLFFSWRLEGLPLTVEAGFEPIGFGLGTGERHHPGSAAVVLAYATDYLEVGLGGGALIGAPGPCYPVCEDNSAATVHQTLRLGTVDGLHVLWRSSIASQEDRFLFGSGRGELQVPVSARLALFGAGGGARSGWAFGEVGVRNFLRGTGGPGSLLLSATLGIVSVFDGESGNGFAGPSVAAGMEWRR